ncbi:hypothetical protein J7J24_02380 [bacterium]|nr:hypothetical protein [bacterium]
MRVLIIIALFLALIGVFFLPSFTFSQIGPPGQEEAEEFVHKVVTSTKPYFGSFSTFWHQKILPFFLNLGEKIKLWWHQKAKIKLINFWKQIVFFLNKEIVIE